MAATAEEICNQALLWVGGSSIASLSDTTKEGVACNLVYAPLRDAVLEDKDWSFAIERAEITAEVATPVFGFDKKFAKPSGFLRAVQVSNASESATASNATGLGRYSEIEWAVEGDFIVALGVETIHLRYIKQITDPTKFSPSFDQALAARIAMDLAIPIAGSRALQRDMAAMYGEKLGLAAVNDGRQGRSLKHRSNSLRRVR